jgi:hypothetical protein
MPMLAWRERTDAPMPAGLVATGAPARALVGALTRRDAAGCAGLSVVATRDVLVVLGPAEQLPWDLPPDLVHAALRHRVGGVALLVWTEPDFVLSLDDRQPVDAAVLAWLDKELG